MTTCTSTKRPAKMVTVRHRQSRFGLAWLAVFLGLAAWTALRPPTAPSRASAGAQAATAPAIQEPTRKLQARMKPIQDYRVGNRFIVTNPLGAELEPEPDAETWSSVDLRLRKPSGKYVTMTLLLSPDEMHELGADRSARVKLDLPEMGLFGHADVMSVGPCPEIESGEGCVVTGTFAHESEGNLVNVFIDGVDQPLGVTDNHPFFSQDRGEFIPAGELRSGERLSGLDEKSTPRVLRVEPRFGDQLVYNIQVNGAHVYHVGPLAVLVHNACVGLPSKYGIEGIYEFTTTTGKKYVGQTSDILRRLKEHIRLKLLDPKDVRTIVYRPVPGGRLTRRIAEQFRIEELGGVDGGFLDNIDNAVEIFGSKFK